MKSLKVTVLGSGTSQGVPVIGCQCNVCKSTDSRDKRLRSSIMFNYNGENFVVDTGPDFRQQMLRENVQSLRAVIYTHEHKDHIAGMDDVRAFNFIEKRDMEIYCTKEVEKALLREFHYAFEANKYPGVPNVSINLFDDEPFQLINGPTIIPIQVMHHKLPVKGFRIGDFTYLTDMKTISDKEIKKVVGTKILILDCLRRSDHISHLNLTQALDFIDYIKPEKTYLTHISHLFDTHDNILKELPDNVEPAYDGLRFEVVTEK